MIYKNEIHIQAQGGKDGNAKGNGTPKANECLCVVHDV
jgi:hypothetical protein